MSEMYSNNYPSISTNNGLRPTYVKVDLGLIEKNYYAIQKKVGNSIVMPIVKANAYGHGLVEVGKHLESIGAEYFGVAYLEEALLLRESGIIIPILVMGGILGDQIPLYLENNITLTASSIEKLSQIEKIASDMNVRAKVHLKIDTGMERIGVHFYSAQSLLEYSLTCESCEIEGIFTHFANADVNDLSHAKLQLDRFIQVLEFYPDNGLPFPKRHAANSAAILQLPESYFDMVRPGIVLYGVYPSEETEKSIQVFPALAWRSQVVYFKVVKPNFPIGYGSTWKSDHLVRVVTIPIGYGDGYFRSMSGKAEILLNDKRYPVVGSICMDQFMVNIEWDSAYNEDEVILIGESANTKITVEDLANWANTIPYEILTNINGRVPRLYVNGTSNE
jgi:alanine racemase